MKAKGRARVYFRKNRDFCGLVLRVKIKMKCKLLPIVCEEYLCIDKYYDEYMEFLKECIRLLRDKEYLKEVAKKMIKNQLAEIFANYIKCTLETKTIKEIKSLIKSINKKGIEVEVDY
jgi:hypothetical protein